MGRTIGAASAAAMEIAPGDVLRTQAEVDAYLATNLAANVEDGAEVPIALAPAEAIDLSRWIRPHECCSACGEVTPRLRVGRGGQPREDCAACGDVGFLTVTWGNAQTDRWFAEHARGALLDARGEKAPVGPIWILGGEADHVADLERQARHARAEVRKVDAVPPDVHQAGTVPASGTRARGK